MPRPAPALCIAALLALFILAALTAVTPSWSGPPPARLPDLSVVAPDPRLSAEVRLVVEETAPGLAAYTGVAPERIRVEVADGERAFQRRAAQLGGPSWAAGLAVPSRGLILLKPPRLLTTPQEFRFLIIHELVHLYLGEALKGRRAPLWLEEGLAMLLSQEGGWDLARNMARGALVEDLIPLGELNQRFPADPARAAVAYAQSYYLVSWYVNTHGQEAMHRLLAELARDRPLTAALRAATGQGLAAMESEFAEHIKDRFSWLALITAGGFIWGILALGMGAALVIRHRRRRAAALEADEGSRGEGRDARHWPPPPARGDVLKEAGLAGEGQEPGDDREESARGG